MEIVLGLAESSYITIGLFVFPALIGLFLGYKQRADTALVDKKIDKKVDKKLAEALKPIIKAQEDFDSDLKELKKDELEPIKKNINILMREQDVMNTILSTLVKTLDRNHEESNRNHLEIKEIMKDRDRSYKENFLLLFEKLDKKVDKK